MGVEAKTMTSWVLTGGSKAVVFASTTRPTTFQGDRLHGLSPSFYAMAARCYAPGKDTRPHPITVSKAEEVSLGLTHRTSPDSSMEEHVTSNGVVAGSSPARADTLSLAQRQFNARLTESYLLAGCPTVRDARHHNSPSCQPSYDDAGPQARSAKIESPSRGRDYSSIHSLSLQGKWLGQAAAARTRS